MKIRRRSHPHNHQPLVGTKESRMYIRRMGRQFGELLNTHGEVIAYGEVMARAKP